MLCQSNTGVWDRGSTWEESRIKQVVPRKLIPWKTKHSNTTKAGKLWYLKHFPWKISVIKHTLIFDLLGTVDPYLIFWRMLLTTWISNKCTHTFSLGDRKGKRKKRLVNESLLFNSLFHRMGRYIYITNNIISNLRYGLVRGERKMFFNQLVRENLPGTQTKPKYVKLILAEYQLRFKSLLCLLQTDTASVLLEAMEYIGFLHEQVKVWPSLFRVLSYIWIC